MPQRPEPAPSQVRLDVSSPADAIDAGVLASAVQSAREQCRAGGDAVLDILLRTWRLDMLQEPLMAVGGVHCMVNADAVHVSWEAWDAARAAGSRAVLARGSGDVPGHSLLALMADPWDDATLRQMQRATGQAVHPVATTRQVLDRCLGEAAAVSPGHPSSGQASSEASGPVVAFVEDALRSAFRSGASDVHFECDRKGVGVKLRLDGVLSPYARMDDPQRAEEVISRIKVLAQLDITERRLPQDGRFRHVVSPTTSIDLRVSVMPSVFGEDAVLRLLDKAQLRGHSAAVTLDALGFDTALADRIRRLATAPSGMLLVTGPTGSGKTTSVYAALSEINTGVEKIVTIEDPVEYELPGVLQIPVNERKGLTFARGLRSILRHDPDRILVGEIRDAETAEIAVQAALTGHLVFTTVHANGVGDIIGRFRHFGLDMFGFMSALNGVVVQRLVRRLCTTCRSMREPRPEELAVMARLLGRPWTGELAQARGCGHCHGSGYRGRFVVAEVHDIDDGFRDRVTEGVNLSALKAYAFSRDALPLAVQAALAVERHETTMEEVARVVGWN